MNKLPLLLLSILIGGCIDKGNNLSRLAEAEKVIAHYKSNPADSLKLKAAIFLIANGREKFAQNGDKMYTKFLRFIDSTSQLKISYDDYKTAISNYYNTNKTLVGETKKVYDSNTVSADFLIKNIDDAVYVYQAAPWCKNLSFPNFCEYILPYRVGQEPLEYFRDSVYNAFKYLTQKGISNRQTLADTILTLISKNSMYIIDPPGFLPDLSFSSLKKLKGGTCNEATNLAAMIMRSVGLPVAIDFTPQWPNRGKGHTWSSLLISEDSCINFEGATSSHVGGHIVLSPIKTLAKVYRKTFSKQENSLGTIHGKEPIPDFFKNTYMTDVSGFYFKGVDVSLTIDGSVENKYGYLCVFDNQKWVPVSWALKKDNGITFSKMGTSIVYLPAIYQNENIVSIGNPVIVNSYGKVHELIPNEKQTQQLLLKRKYPVFDWWNTRTAAMKGGVFQAANKPDFSDAEIVYKIKTVPEMTYQTVQVKTPKKFKFWRYLGADSSFGAIAELEFYSGEKVLEGKIIGTDATKRTKKHKQNVFDNNPLTYFDGDLPNNNWVGMSFNEPVQVQKIRYLCWNDDNFIKNGEVYELFYWVKGKWRSLGRQIGSNSQVLTYTKVPSNALYLLRNRTKGKEERIFTYENGKQYWW